MQRLSKFNRLITMKTEEKPFNVESTPKSQKPLNPLKGTLKSSLIFSKFPFRGQG